MSQYLAHADIVITATACPIPFITRDMVQSALVKRNQKPLYFLDLALPRNIEANITTLPHLTLCNLDDLKSACDENLSLRQSAAHHAEQLIENNSAYYCFCDETTNGPENGFATSVTIPLNGESKVAPFKFLSAIIADSNA